MVEEGETREGRVEGGRREGKKEGKKERERRGGDGVIHWVA